MAKTREKQRGLESRLIEMIDILRMQVDRVDQLILSSDKKIKIFEVDLKLDGYQGVRSSVTISEFNLIDDHSKNDCHINLNPRLISRTRYKCFTTIQLANLLS